MNNLSDDELKNRDLLFAKNDISFRRESFLYY